MSSICISSPRKNVDNHNIQSDDNSIDNATQLDAENCVIPQSWPIPSNGTPLKKQPNPNPNPNPNPKRTITVEEYLATLSSPPPLPPPFFQDLKTKSLISQVLSVAERKRVISSVPRFVVRSQGSKNDKVVKRSSKEESNGKKLRSTTASKRKELTWNRKPVSTNHEQSNHHLPKNNRSRPENNHNLFDDIQETQYPRRKDLEKPIASQISSDCVSVSSSPHLLQKAKLNQSPVKQSHDEFFIHDFTQQQQPHVNSNSSSTNQPVRNLLLAKVLQKQNK